MLELVEMHEKWKNSNYTPTPEELSILGVYDLIEKYTPEDEKSERVLQLSLLVSDISEFVPAVEE